MIMYRPILYMYPFYHCDIILMFVFVQSIVVVIGYKLVYCTC